MRKFPFIQSAFVIFATILLAACGKTSSETGGAAEGADDSSSFVVAIAAPLTGESSEFGAQLRMGAELFQEQLNAAGGIDGRKLELQFGDDAGKAEQAQTVATNIASNDEVMAVLGHYNSSCSLAGKGLYTDAGLVMFSPASTNVEVTKNSDFVYRNIFTDDFQGISLANYVAKVLELKNVAILFDNDDYGSGLKESFKGEAQKLGLNVVNELAFTRDAPDFRSQLTTIQGNQTPPDVILIAGLYTQGANIARQARDLGLTAQIIGGDGLFSEKYISLAGAAAEGTFISCPFLVELGGEKASSFVDAFKSKYNREPDAWAALSYDAMAILCEGMKKNGISREAVQEYLKTVNSPETAFSGVVGDTYFDAEGDCRRPVQMAQVKDGKYVPAEKQLTAE